MIALPQKGPVHVTQAGAMLVTFGDDDAPTISQTVTFDPASKTAAGSLKTVLAEGSTNGDGTVRIKQELTDFPPVVGDVNTLGQALAIDCTHAASMMLHVRNTAGAAMTAGVFTFEGSVDSTDGVNGTWFTIQAARTNGNTVETGTTPALASLTGMGWAWKFSANNIAWIRVRCTTTVAGGSTHWTAIRGQYASESTPGVGTHAVTGSGNFTTIPVAGTPITITAAATTNLAVIVATPATLSEITVFNPTAATVFVKLYNKTTTPAPATDVPLVTIPVAAGALVALQFGEVGKRFAAGMGIGITGGAAATDTTALAAAGVQVSGTRF